MGGDGYEFVNGAVFGVPGATAVGQCRRLSGLEAALAYLLRLGITAWQDAAVEPLIHAAYLELAPADRLPVDVVGALKRSPKQRAEPPAGEGPSAVTGHRRAAGSPDCGRVSARTAPA